MFGKILVLLSFLIVAFGQPVWGAAASFLTATAGLALFWWEVLKISPKQRFWLGTFWYTAVSLVQQGWLLSHPYAYIYPLWVLLSFLWGIQFGILCYFVTPERVSRIRGILSLAALWTLLEWSRLYILSGYSFNPIGLALAGNLWTLQIASLFGVFGMSFWVAATNLFLLSWFSTGRRGILALVFIFFPFLFGWQQVWSREEAMKQQPPFSALLVQTSFPIEEICPFETFDALKNFVEGEWSQICKMTAPYLDKKYDLIVLPEYVVPFGTYTFVYSYENALRTLLEAYGIGVIDSLPPLELPLAHQNGGQWFVSNAYFAQTIANHFNANLVLGLEDSEDVDGHREFYSAALFFAPRPNNYEPRRYAKQILVPMGEYIPFAWCKQLAQNYGVGGSFTPGSGPVVWEAGGVSFGSSICYEETFGDLMRQNRKAGAKMLVNLTSDIWYPHSMLIWQHLEHARIRTVEMGVPLLRSCNTGITCGIDSLGRDVAIFAQDAEDPEDVSGALPLEISPYSYQTLYSQTGDGPLIGVCFFFVLAGQLFDRRNRDR